MYNETETRKELLVLLNMSASLKLCTSSVHLCKNVFEEAIENAKGEVFRVPAIQLRIGITYACTSLTLANVPYPHCDNLLDKALSLITMLFNNLIYFSRIIRTVSLISCIK